MVGCALNHPNAVRPYMTVFNARQLAALARAGTAVDTVAPVPLAPPVGPFSAYSTIPPVEEWGPYTVHHPRIVYGLPKRWFYGLTGRSYARRIPRFIEHTFDRPDVIHACAVYPDGYGLLDYCTQRDIPLFTVAHGILSNSYAGFSRTVKTRIRRVLEGSTAVICVSDSLADLATDLVPEATVEVVPLGAEPARFPVDRKAEIRTELGLPPDATVVLFVGSFSERKGIDDLIELLPTLELPDTEFIFVGHGGDRRQALQRAIRSSPFSNRYLYWKITSIALRRLYVAADLLVLPSRSEGRPMVIYEAMASKTAVLASNVDGIPEQISDGETGVLLPPRDPATLKSTLEALVADRAGLETMGERGLERLIEQGWTWTAHADRLQALHRTAIEH